MNEVCCGGRRAGIGILHSVALNCGDSRQLDTATVRVERDPAARGDNLAEFDSELIKLIKRRLKNDTNVNFEVEVLAPNSLERAISKAKRVDDRRPRFRPG